MQTRKKQLFLGYMALIYAMMLSFSLISNFTSRTSENWRFFYAFTQQSNIIVLLCLALFGIDSFKKMPYHKLAHSKLLITAITVYISITFFIVAFVLSPIYNGKWNPLSSTGELMHHQITPIVMWVYFFLVRGEGKLRLKHALTLLIYPFLYTCANLLIGANVKYLDGKGAYAYGFINPASYPNYFVFGLVIVGLIAIFALFGVLLIKLKQYLEGCTEKEN